MILIQNAVIFYIDNIHIFLFYLMYYISIYIFIFIFDIN